MQSTVSFAPLRPAGFVNFCGAGQPVFPRGEASIPDPLLAHWFPFVCPGPRGPFSVFESPLGPQKHRILQIVSLNICMEKWNRVPPPRCVIFFHSNPVIRQRIDPLGKNAVLPKYEGNGYRSECQGFISASSNMMYFLSMVKVLQEFFGILKISQVQNFSTRLSGNHWVVEDCSGTSVACCCCCGDIGP